MAFAQRSRHYLWRCLALILLVSILGPGCRGAEPEPGDEPSATVKAVLTATPPPPVIVTVAAPQGGQSLHLPSAPEPAVTLESEAVRQAAQTDGETLQASPTPTPAATFTPPSSPEPAASEHFWLGRPVPQGGVVWTDKAYPYGSTKGGLLRPHHGVEFNVVSGTPVLSAAAGTVRVAGPDDSQIVAAEPDFYGLVVVIEHDFQLAGQPVFTLYGHLSEILVTPGEKVSAGGQIARSGASGVADGPHLHFEVRVGQNIYGSTRNPLLWLYPFPDRGVVAGRVTWPNGTFVHEAPIQLRRIDAPSAYAATTTYAAEGVNPDDVWGENFALDDVEAGFYEIVIGTGSQETKLEVWVYPRQTTFIEVNLGSK